MRLIMCGVLAGILLANQQVAWTQSRPLVIRPGVGVSELFVLNSPYQASLRAFQSRYALATNVAPTLTFQDQTGNRFFDFFRFGLRLVVHDDLITQLVFLAPTISINGAQWSIVTAREIKVGTPESQVQRAYGEPSKREPVVGGEVWYYTCIGFDLSSANVDRTVRAIVVYGALGRRCEN